MMSLVNKIPIYRNYDISQVFVDCNSNENPDSLSVLNESLNSNKSTKKNFLSKKMAKPPRRRTSFRYKIDTNDNTGNLTNRSVDSVDLQTPTTDTYLTTTDTSRPVSFDESPTNISNLFNESIFGHNSKPQNDIKSQNDMKVKTLSGQFGKSLTVTTVKDEKFWLYMFKNWIYQFKYNKVSLKRSVDKGICDSMRGVIWSNLISLYSSANKEKYEKFSIKYPNLYDQDIFSTSSVDMMMLYQINHDISLLLQNDSNVNSTLGEEAIRHVLTRFAIIDDKVKYNPGFTYIAAVFAAYLTPDSAFYAFIGLMNHGKSPLYQLYLPTGVAKMSDVIRKHLSSSILKHLTILYVDIVKIAMDWAKSIFLKDFSFELVIRIVDIAMYQGLNILLKVVIAILKTNRKILLSAKSHDEAIKVINHIPDNIEVDSTIKMALNISL